VGKLADELWAREMNDLSAPISKGILGKGGARRVFGQVAAKFT
jgi:hypothetical protein